MFSPIEVSIRPSRGLRWLNHIGHFGVAVLLCLSTLPLYVKLLSPLVLLLSALWVSRRQMSAVDGLRWDADRRELAVRYREAGWLRAEQLEAVTVLPWLLIIRLRLGTAWTRLVIVPDSVSPSAFRRLAVLARLAPLELSEPDRATRS